MSRQTNIQIRRGTASDWASVNPTLAAGEIAMEQDTFKIKVGDGSTAWNNLQYLKFDGGNLDGAGAGTTTTAAPTTTTGAPTTVGINSVTLSGITGNSSLNGTYTRVVGGDQNNNNGCYQGGAGTGPNAVYQKGSYYLTTDSGPNWIINSQADGYGTVYAQFQGMGNLCGPTINWILNDVALMPAGTWEIQGGINYSLPEQDWFLYYFDTENVTVTTT